MRTLAIALLLALTPSPVLGDSCVKYRDGAGGTVLKWSDDRPGTVLIVPGRCGLSGVTRLCLAVTERCVPLAYDPPLANPDRDGPRIHYRSPLRGRVLLDRLGASRLDDRSGWIEYRGERTRFPDIAAPRID